MGEYGAENVLDFTEYYLTSFIKHAAKKGIH